MKKTVVSFIIFSLFYLFLATVALASTPPQVIAAISSQPSNTYQGNTIFLAASVRNDGTTAVENVTISWALPEDWAANDSLVLFVGNLTKTQGKAWHNITVSISPNSSTGTKTAYITATYINGSGTLAGAEQNDSDTTNVKAAMNVTLNSPNNNIWKDTIGNISFKFTPKIYSNNFEYLNCSLWNNETGVWELKIINQFEILNNTQNNISWDPPEGANIQWAVQCFNNASVEYWSANRTLLADSINPAVSFITPAGNISLNPAKNLLNVTVTLGDSTSQIRNANLTIKQSGTLFNWAELVQMGGDNISGLWSAILNLSELPEGIYDLAIKAWDTADNKNTTEKIKVTIDKISPMLLVGGNGIWRDTQTAVILVAGNESLANCRYVTNGSTQYGTMNTAFLEGNGTQNVQTGVSGAYGQTYNLYIGCIDLAGNEQYANTSIFFAASAPAIFVPGNMPTRQGTKETGLIVPIVSTENGGIAMVNAYNLASVVLEATEVPANAKITITVPEFALGANMPSRIMYRQYTIGANYQMKNQTKIRFNFKVAKNWLTVNNASAETVSFNRLTENGWMPASVALVGESGANYLFTAEMQEFGSFAVTVEGLAKAEPTRCDLACQGGQILDKAECRCHLPALICKTGEYLDIRHNECIKKTASLTGIIVAGLNSFNIAFVIAAIFAAFVFLNKWKKI